MGQGFAKLPDDANVRLVNARVPTALFSPPPPAVSKDDLTTVDILIDKGNIAAIGAPGSLPGEPPAFDLRQGIVFPGFVDCHTHLDKGHIWPRRRNPDGTFQSALENVKADRIAHWSRQDVLARMDFSLRCALAHGTTAIRTHIDSAFGQEDITWPLLPALRQEWQGRIELQFSSLASADLMCDEGFARKLATLVKAADGTLGCVTYRTPNLAAALRNLFSLAQEFDLDVDFHVDETQDPESRSLAAIADQALATGFERRILVGHCCSLTRQPAEAQYATIDKLARAGIGVVSLPMCNLYLQERHAGVTPRYRGVTLLHELKAAGVRVAVASDNTRDPFYAYGDLDGLEVYREATRICHFDHPVGDWPKAITATPADLMGLSRHGRLAIGAPADLVLFCARSWTELLSRPQADRTVLRQGRAIDTTLPDYAELDDLVGAP